MCVDPSVVYHIQDSGAGTPTYEFPGLNAVLIFTHSGNTATGISQAELDAGGDVPAADDSNQLFIWGIADLPNNELGDNAIWEVTLNQTHWAPNNGLGMASTS